MRKQIKTGIKTIAEKNRTVNRISEAILERDVFLLLGHKDPDIDCIASLVAFALFLAKFNKEITLYLAGPVMPQFSYLLAICKYNGISVVYGKLSNVKTYSAVTILDTPKPDMIALNDEIAAHLEDEDICKIEIDHHLERDATYSGDEGYCLVAEASSTSELVGYFLLKMESQKDRFGNMNFFSLNLALAILTGIVGDSQMGKYLKTRREKFYYRIFTDIFNELLGKATHRGNKNLSSIEEVFDVIQNFSVREKHCYDGIMQLKNTEKTIYYACLDKTKSAEFFKDFGSERIVNVSKAIANKLAEDSNKLGLVVYYDDPSLSDFVQFRLRRSAKYLHVDLRDVLTGLEIEIGGGHPGAIGFRVKKDEITDIESYVVDIIDRIEKLVGETTD